MAEVARALDWAEVVRATGATVVVEGVTEAAMVAAAGVLAAVAMEEVAEVVEAVEAAVRGTVGAARAMVASVVAERAVVVA